MNANKTTLSFIYWVFGKLKAYAYVMQNLDVRQTIFHDSSSMNRESGLSQSQHDLFVKSRMQLDILCKIIHYITYHGKHHNHGGNLKLTYSTLKKNYDLKLDEHTFLSLHGIQWISIILDRYDIVTHVPSDDKVVPKSQEEYRIWYKQTPRYFCDPNLDVIRASSGNPNYSESCSLMCQPLWNRDVKLPLACKDIVLAFATHILLDTTVVGEYFYHPRQQASREITFMDKIELGIDGLVPQEQDSIDITTHGSRFADTYFIIVHMSLIDSSVFIVTNPTILYLPLDHASVFHLS